MRLLKLSFLTLITGLLVFTIACQKEQETDQTAQKAEVFKATNGQAGEPIIIDGGVGERCPDCPTPDPVCSLIEINALVPTGAKITVTFPGQTPNQKIEIPGPALQKIILKNTSIPYADVKYELTGPGGGLPAGGGLAVETFASINEIFILPVGAPNQTRRFILCDDAY